MDQQITVKFYRKKWFILLSVFLFLSFMSITLWVLSRDISQTVDRKSIRIASVVYGPFQELITVSGTVEPKHSLLIDAREGGIIVDILAENGSMVHQGQALLKLENEASTLDFMQRESQMVEQINNLRNTRIALNQNQRQTEDALMEAELQLSLAERSFQIDSFLFQEDATPQQSYYQSSKQYDHWQRKSRLLKHRIDRDKDYLASQIKRIDESIRLMERNLDRIRKHLQDLIIYAPIAGQLSSFDHEIGTSIQKNAVAGRIDQPGTFIIQANLDQHFLDRIKENQQAIIKKGTETYSLTIYKVFPTVNNGQFEIKLAFNEAAPPDLRRGQIFQVQIATSGKRDAVLAPKGAYFNSSGGKYVYVLNDSKTEARKRMVRFGSQNDQYYEVLEGLEAGEQIITSEYQAFKESQQISIQ